MLSRHTEVWVNQEGHHNDTWFVNRKAYVAKLTGFMAAMHEEGVKFRAPKPASETQRRVVVKYATISEPVTQ